MLPGLNQSKFNFKDLVFYLGLMQKHMRLIGLLMCVGVLVGLNYYVYKRPVYRARAIYRLKEFATPLEANEVYHDSGFRVILPQLRARDVRKLAALNIGLDPSVADAGNLSTYHIPYLQIIFNLPDKIQIVLNAYEQSVAAKYPDALVNAYLQMREDKRQELKKEAFEKYTVEIDEVNVMLEELYRNKYEFEQQNQTTLLKIEHGKYLQIPRLLASTKERLDQLGMVKGQIESPELDPLQKIAIIYSFQQNRMVNRLDSVTSVPGDAQQDFIPQVGELYQSTSYDGQFQDPMAAAAPKIVVMPSMMEEKASWEDMETDLMRVENEIRLASQTYLPGHKRMKALNKQREDILSNINIEYEFYRKQIELEEAHLLDLEQKLEAKLPEYELVKLQNEQIQEKLSQFVVAERDFGKITKKLYEKMQAVITRYDRDNADIEFVGWDIYPDTLTSVSKLKALLGGLVLGLGLSVVIPFLLEYLDHTVTSMEAGEAALQLRGLGIVPKIEDSSLRGSLLLSDDKESKILMENIRNVRSHLLFGRSDADTPQIIMLSSACPREGKSFISSNLAVSFANLEEKTLLIDADLRRGRLDMLFGIKGRPGLKDVLRGEKDIEEVIYKTVIPNLYLLPVGRGDRKSSELLISNRLIKNINQLRDEYDRIVVDSPPVLGLSDATVLQKAVDSVIMVVASNQTASADVKNAVKWLRTNGGNLIGFVLNKLDLSVSSNYYQYYYYSKSYYEDYSPERALGAKPARKKPEALPHLSDDDNSPYGA